MATFGKKRPLASDASVQPSKKSKTDSRNFKDCWLQEFKWLEYKSDSKQMFCKLCTQCQKFNLFTSGCSMLKKDNISKHEKSKDHKDAELASRLLVAPVATADCERGFSKQNFIKTHLRNSLKIQNLNNLMTLAIDGPAVEHFDFKRAFGKWAGLKSRRILN